MIIISWFLLKLTSFAFESVFSLSVRKRRFDILCAPSLSRLFCLRFHRFVFQTFDLRENYQSKEHDGLRTDSMQDFLFNATASFVYFRYWCHAMLKFGASVLFARVSLLKQSCRRQTFLQMF